MPRRRRALASRLAMLSLISLAVSPLAACDAGAPEPEPAPGPAVESLSFGVFGAPAELAAYRRVVEDYNERSPDVEVELQTWPDAEALTADLVAGEAPDVYLLERHDLATVVEDELNEPLFDLLEARNVSYGDDFAQRVLEAFSADDDLQCMPYASSPQVVYLNRDLVDFDAMAVRGLPVPEDELEGWSFDQFAAAADFASRGRVRGVSIGASLEALSPFLLSGGAQLVDDQIEPTSLTLAGGSDRDALSTLLGLLRQPELTLSNEQLDRASPEEWFERGRLGMVVGSRALTPRLREVDGLSFDVMPIPSLGSAATVGDVLGLCVAPGDHVGAAVDFLVDAISPESLGPVVETGYVVPATIDVARSAAFLQPDLQPANAGAFNASVDTLRLLPPAVDEPELAAVVDPLLSELLTAPIIDVDELTAEIDEASRSVLDPDYVPEPDPSESAEPDDSAGD